jgi:Type II secretion system (T2SS), protein M subtype b
MKFYRQSILVFGFFIPILIGVLLLMGAYYFKENIFASYNKNVIAYGRYEKERKDCLTIEGKLLPERPAMERWGKLLSEKTATTVVSQLREIMVDVSKSDLQETSSIPSSTKAGFGTVSEHRSSQLQITFRGTYCAMQKVLLKLETRFPQLQLNDLKIDPNTNQSSLLNFQVSYTAWEN